MRIGVIPARGGSKRIPRKNIKDFCGKPMIAWSIQALQDSGAVEKVIVSTDDQEIAEIAQQFGAEIPFIRPSNIADDFTGTTAVVGHAVRWCLESYGKNQLEAVCCLYATAPFVVPEDLMGGLNTLLGGSWDYVFSATSYDFPVQRALILGSNGGVSPMFPEKINSRSQDLVEAIHDAGQFYWGKPDAWINEKEIFTSNSVALKIPRFRVQDIDTVEDWDRALQLFKVLNL